MKDDCKRELNENGELKYVLGSKYTYSTLMSYMRDDLIDLLRLAQDNYECVNERLYNVSKYAVKLDEALDKACDLLEKSKAGTTCDEENRKNCMENHCFNTCIYARKMNKEEWKKYLMRGEKE